MFNLTGKVALVTGARQGMGKSHALALAAQGAKITVTDISQEDCQLVADEIQKSGGEAVAFKLDVSKMAEVKAVFAQAAEHFGRLDILVNNAGIYSTIPAIDMGEEEWDRMLAINLKGEFFCAQEAAKLMARNNWGRIINIASIASGGAGIGIQGSAHYTASKGGIIGMSETLAIEWAPLGITVNVIAPGAVDTPMADIEHTPKEQIDALLAGIPLKRIGMPAEVSAAVVFLASDESSYITGSTIYVDGGWLAA